MRCFHPLTAWQREDSSITFVERGGDIARQLKLRCGKCIGCRLSKSEDWAIRCMHESKMHASSCFITLTYDDDHLPQNGSLHYPDFQKFAKRARKKKGPFRFFVAGEYGDLNGRPHYHACLFGVSFDRSHVVHTGPYPGADVYESPELSALWPFGYSSVGDFSYQSAAYVARYCVKKVSGELATEHYTRMDQYGQIVEIVPEFGHMSLRPGLGSTFHDKYKDEMLRRDAVVVSGRERKVPRYYDTKYGRSNPYEQDSIEYDRYLAGQKAEEVTEEQLIAEEKIAYARQSYLKRTL